jgi:hypothetical protein
MTDSGAKIRMTANFSNKPEESGAKSLRQNNCQLEHHTQRKWFTHKLRKDCRHIKAVYLLSQGILDKIPHKEEKQNYMEI